jgi:hypothetical protein
VPDEDQTGEKNILDEIIGDSVKLFALAGTFIYGALFLGYQSYYSDLGIHPEDVGVSHAFVLIRSIGFILLAAGIALVILVYAWVIARRKGIAVVDYFVILLAGAAVYFYAHWLLPPDSSMRFWRYSVAIIFVPAFLLGVAAENYAVNAKTPRTKLTAAERRRIRRWEKRRAQRKQMATWALRNWPRAAAPVALAVVRFRRLLPTVTTLRPALNVGMGLTVLLTVLLPAIAIDKRADQLAEQSLRGERVAPFTLFNIVPVLDVSSEYIRASWICPEGEHPPVFDGPKGNYLQGLSLGETGTSLFMRLQVSDGGKENKSNQSYVIVKLPQECVMTVRGPQILGSVPVAPEKVALPPRDK